MTISSILAFYIKKTARAKRRLEIGEDDPACWDCISTNRLSVISASPSLQFSSKTYLCHQSIIPGCIAGYLFSSKRPGKSEREHIDEFVERIMQMDVRDYSKQSFVENEGLKKRQLAHLAVDPLAQIKLMTKPQLKVILNRIVLGSTLNL